MFGRVVLHPVGMHRSVETTFPEKFPASRQGCDLEVRGRVGTPTRQYCYGMRINDLMNFFLPRDASLRDATLPTLNFALCTLIFELCALIFELRT